MLRSTIALSLMIAAAPLAAQNPNAAAHYEHLRALTQMDRAGAQPFHIKIDAQIYDFQGNPSETGAIEEWWASPNEYRIEINSGTLHEVEASGEPAQTAPLTRTSYLLHLLLQQTVNPLGALYANATVSKSPRTFEDANLTCLSLHESFEVAEGLPTFCVDKGTDDLRLIARDFELALRNTPGTFVGERVALSTIISYFGHDAINGELSVIEALKPDSAGTPALKIATIAPTVAATTSNATEHLRRKGSASGHIYRKPAPVYPAAERTAHIEGTVLVHAVITPEGRLTSLFVLASPDDALAQSALDAVSHWHCDPYRLNGKPTEVATTIPVVFKLNP